MSPPNSPDTSFSSVCVASIVRIYYLLGLFQNVDVTWWMGPSFAWSSLEPSVAVISACLPTFAPLFRMGRKGTSRNSPYPGYAGERSGAVSGGTGRGAMGSHHAAGVRLSRSNTGAFGKGRGSGGHAGIEDDEVELTCKVTCGDTMSSRDAGSKGSSDYDRGIMVRTQVSVVSQKQDQV